MMLVYSLILILNIKPWDKCSGLLLQSAGRPFTTATHPVGFIGDSRGSFRGTISPEKRIKLQAFRLYEHSSEESDLLYGDNNDKISLIKSQISTIIDPNKGTDIISSGIVGGIRVQGSDVELDLILSKSNVAVADELKKLCLFEISMIDWVKDIRITLLTDKPPTIKANANTGSGLDGVKNIIAVSSCKGGVGKSTVSVNLAYTLQQAGAKVGILDADIYGPSLPTMTSPNTRTPLYSANRLVPLEYRGVKLLSLGFINKGAAIMRGPMVNQILNQFVSLAEWGELDYLIIDMPPGTGDIQLTLAQVMNITAAVIVTTPQKLSFVDVVKGIDMFDTVNVPSIAVVENMAEFSTYSFDKNFFDGVGADVAKALLSSEDDQAATASALIREAVERQRQPLRVFGPGHLQRLRDMWGVEILVSLPLLPEVALSGDSGHPYVLTHPSSALGVAFAELARGVQREVRRLAEQAVAPPPLRFRVEDCRMEFGEATFPAYDLRCDCRCAVCVEELTGRSLLDKESVPKSVGATAIAPIGRYAISVDWSDGHKSLYPYKQIAALADTTQ